MARGNYWQNLYDPDLDDTTLIGGKKLYDYCSEGNSSTTIGLEKHKFNEPINEITFKNLTLKICDIKLQAQKSTFKTCTFTKCDFSGSIFDEVKFSTCTFIDCDFSYVSLTNCVFVTCNYSGNSASAEHSIFKNTAIDASKFLTGLDTNLLHLKTQSIKHIQNLETKKVFQKHRLELTKAKLAKTLFVSNKEVAEIEFYHIAYKEFSLHNHKATIEEHKFKYKRDGTVAVRTPKHIFFAYNICNFIEYGVTRLTGFLTNWGRSVMKATFIFFFVVVLFTFVYWGIEYFYLAELTKSNLMQAPKECGAKFLYYFLQSMEISLVAGYTSYSPKTIPLFYKGIMVFNMSLGLYWYSIIIHSIIRRVHD